MRYAVKLAYDGSLFSGWQKQPGRVTVQGVLENALETFCHEKTAVHGAGRTDKGVHALGQVASFDLTSDKPAKTVLLATNANLPEPVRVVDVTPVVDSFHARRSALWREYVYHVWTGGACYPQIRRYVWWNGRRRWDMERIREACRRFAGTHDFSAFCRASERPEYSVRIISSMTVARRGPLVRFRVRGNAFLTNMVRIMIGTIDRIGAGEWEPHILDRLLEGADRTEAGPTAPAEGLTLQKVGYASLSWPGRSFLR
ncbi:MAG: tRNA pseudouridine(38-40) synthase TruA [Thermovirgaceae bacterium]